MKNHIRPTIAAGAALFTLAVLSAPAQAQGDLSGHWAGFGRSATVNPGPPNLASFDVFTQNGRRFTGAVRISSQYPPNPCEGTISASGVLNATGRDAFGNLIEVHGRVRDFRPPNPNAPTDPCRIAALRYKVNGPLLHEEGYLLFVQGQRCPNPGPPDIGGTWNGTFTSRRSFGSNEVHHNTTQDRDAQGLPLPTFHGTASFFYPPDPGMPNGSFFDFDVQGTVGLPAVQADGSSAALFASIGAAQPNPDNPNMPQGLVAILVGTWTKPGPPQDPNQNPGPPTIQGGYALYGSFFDVFSDVFNGTAQTFDDGMFNLTGG